MSAEKTSEEKFFSILNILLIELRAHGAEIKDSKVYHYANVLHRAPPALLSAAKNSKQPDYDEILDTIYQRADDADCRRTFERWADF
jgi:hypothetical protein